MYAGMKWIATALALTAFPALSGPTDHDTTLTVLSGWTAPDGSQMVGLRIDMAQGWKTYWRAPGDAGIPPQVSWAGSQNIASAAFHWPVPEVFYEGNLRSIGYTETVTVPMQIYPDTNGREMRLSGTLDIGVCDEICVPVSLPFDVAITPSTTRDAAIVAALVNRPATASEARIGSVTCAIEPASDGVQITARVDVPSTVQPQAVIVETADPMIWVSEPDMTRAGRTLTAQADLIHVTGDPFMVDRSGIRITLLSGGAAVDIQGCAAP